MERRQRGRERCCSGNYPGSGPHPSLARPSFWQPLPLDKGFNVRREIVREREMTKGKRDDKEEVKDVKYGSVQVLVHILL